MAVHLSVRIGGPLARFQKSPVRKISEGPIGSLVCRSECRRSESLIFPNRAKARRRLDSHSGGSAFYVVGFAAERGGAPSTLRSSVEGGFAQAPSRREGACPSPLPPPRGRSDPPAAQGGRGGKGGKGGCCGGGALLFRPVWD